MSPQKNGIPTLSPAYQRDVTGFGVSPVCTCASFVISRMIVCRPSDVVVVSCVGSCVFSVTVCCRSEYLSASRSVVDVSVSLCSKTGHVTTTTLDNPLNEPIWLVVVKWSSVSPRRRISADFTRLQRIFTIFLSGP
ncbi:MULTISPECIES: hypothetical protein [Butyricimonas]|uniref:hypothetical protein n=1 Tax=Butyricimonas TaxID=574697 RepID=UPI0018ABD111|nr:MULTISPECIES: hypothetical protein [Butyricimonas]